MRLTLYSFIFASILLMTASLVDAYQSQSNIDSSYDCSNVALDEIDPNSLTREERIALLDGRLRESIDSYSTCISQVSENMSGNGSGSYAGAENDSASSGAGSSGQTSESEAAMSDSQSNSEHAIQVNTTPVNKSVIPPKDNDKIICKLLFQEIKSTQDTAMLKGLTEQYSNYKCGGL